MAMHWTTTGEPDHIAQRVEIFRLPLFGFAALLGDVVLGIWLGLHDRLVARFLYAGGAAVQIIFWAAAINIAA